MIILLLRSSIRTIFIYSRYYLTILKSGCDGARSAHRCPLRHEAEETDGARPGVPQPPPSTDTSADVQSAATVPAVPRPEEQHTDCREEKSTFYFCILHYL